MDVAAVSLHSRHCTQLVLRRNRPSLSVLALVPTTLWPYNWPVSLGLLHWPLWAFRFVIPNLIQPLHCRDEEMRLTERASGLSRVPGQVGHRARTQAQDSGSILSFVLLLPGLG